MKKFTTILTLLAICATLTGCGNKGTSSSGTTSSTTSSAAESTTSGTASATSGTESETSGTDESTDASAETGTPTQEQDTADGLIAVTSEDVNKAIVSVSDITEADGNKQVAYVADIPDVATVFNYYVFDSDDKFACSYVIVNAQPNIAVNTLLSAMGMNENFAEYTEVEPGIWQSPMSYPNEATEGVPLYSNGVQFAKDTLQETADLFNAMRDAGYVSDGGDAEISTSGDIDFSDAEVYVYGEDTSSDNSTTVVEEGNTYAGSSLTLANPYAVNPDGLFDLESYTLTVNSGETMALPINSLPDGDVTFSLSEPCATLIYNGELTLKGLYEGSTTLTITASNGKTGSIMIMVQ